MPDFSQNFNQKEEKIKPAATANLPLEFAVMNKVQLTNIHGAHVDELIEYVPNREFELWLQKLSHTVILCMLSGIALIILCQWYPILRDLLYAFFRWLLIPVKPLLVAKANGALYQFISTLTVASNIVNMLVVPVVVYFAYRAGRLSSYLLLQEKQILFLQQVSFVPTETGTTVYLNLGGKYYKIKRKIKLRDIENLEVLRPQCKKSYRDYILRVTHMDTRPLIGGPVKMNIRWGDIVHSKDRTVFLSYLEDSFPKKIDPTIFEPFRMLPQRQSYTELWLKELSGAPKRDKLTPLPEMHKLNHDKYTVLRKAGVGGQGTVYLAQCNEAGREAVVVLKEFVLPIYPDLRVRKKAAERFQAEASMLSRLKHDQIAQFLDLFVEDHRAYLVLEHIDGQTLKDLVLSQGPMPEAQVIELASQICNILAYLHNQEPPVIHRDISPDNIMLGPDGKAKLIDFSVAQELSSGVTGSVVGKPNYISPEQFRGKPTNASDLYSLGATLFFLLTAKEPPPITVLHPAELNDKTSAAKTSDSLDAIVARSTQQELEKRYAKAEELLEDLKALA